MKDQKLKIGTIQSEDTTLAYYSDDLNLSNSNYLDSLTKLAILTTMAAYGKAQKIDVSGSILPVADTVVLEKFLSYIVNHPYFAPIKFDFRISFSEVEKHKVQISDEMISASSSILTFSGGIDSTAGLMYMLDRKIPAIPFTLYMGQKNEKYEKVIIHNLLNKLGRKGYSVEIDLSPFILDNSKTWSYIVPARNFIYLCFAAKLASNSQSDSKSIYLFAHKDEMNRYRNTDKSQYFLNKSAILFSDCYGSKYSCITPFKNYDKTQVLSYWRKFWLNKYGISPHDTTTCHDARACGVCDGCLKRTISLLAAGFNEDPYLENHPFLDKTGIIGQNWIPMIKQGALSSVRLCDLLIAIERVDPTVVAPHVLELLKLKNSMNRKLHYRKKKIEETKF